MCTPQSATISPPPGQAHRGQEASTVEALQQAVLGWYAEHGRQLWWRRLPPDPYRVWVTEVMLQQTQVERVERLLPAFLRRFPTVQSLAEAPVAEVIRWWQGLGYNRRARLLWECAQVVVAAYGGRFPDEPAELQRLPGIGTYTAAAIATFAFGRQDVPVVDTNVSRVLQRVWGEEMSPRQLRERARRWIPQGYSAQWHQALMDIGALYCRKRLPLCSQCPLRPWCRSAGQVVVDGQRKVRREPVFAGIPRRLWRGRLLNMVARVGQLRMAEAAQQLFGAAPTHAERRWLRHVVESLVRDGLLCRRGDLLCLPR